MYEEIDLVLRFILMCFFFIFTVISLLNYKRTKEKGLEVSSKYFLAMSFFFALSLFNYIQGEINIHAPFYPDMTYDIPFSSPPLQIQFATVIGMIIFIPSFLPLVFVNEKFFQKWKRPYVTIIGIGNWILILMTVLSPAIYLITFTIALIWIIVTLILFISLYVRMAIKASGILRRSAIMMIIGWILQIIAIVFPIPLAPSYDQVFARIIAIVGACCLFYGIKISSE